MNREFSKKNKCTKKILYFCIFVLIITPLFLLVGCDEKEIPASTEQSTESPVIQEEVEEEQPIDRELTPEEYEQMRYNNGKNQLDTESDRNFMTGSVNLLVIGIDESRGREHWVQFRTDTIMLIKVDFDNERVDLISIPRDSLVYVHGFGGKKRINNAFADGGGYDKNGFEYLEKTIAKMTGGIEIDHYFCVDMEAFKKIVDGVGGVEFYVDVPVNTTDAKLDIGQQTLYGDEVLAYCRQKIGSSDIARVGRQQKILLAIFDKLKTEKTIVYMPFLYKDVAEDVYTDLSFSRICALTLFAFNFDLENLHYHMVEGEYLDIGGVSLWGIDQTKLEELILEVYGLDVTLDKYNDVSYIKPRAERYNDMVVSAESALSKGYRSYLLTNRNYINDNEFTNFLSLENNLTVAKDTISLTDPNGTADMIKAAMNSYNSCFTKYKLLIEQRRAEELAALATPTPDTSTPTPDTSTPTPDTSTPTPDTSTPTPDTSTPTPDTSTPTPDTSTPTPDTSTPTPDTSTPTPDTSTPTPESSSTETSVETTFE